MEYFGSGLHIETALVLREVNCDTFIDVYSVLRTSSPLLLYSLNPFFLHPQTVFGRFHYVIFIDTYICTHDVCACMSVCLTYFDCFLFLFPTPLPKAMTTLSEPS
jgi:hypothetical protein